MKSIDIYCPARINLHLNIDGFNKEKELHYLNLVNQTINIFDVINIRKNNKKEVPLQINANLEVLEYLYDDLFKIYQLFYSYTKREFDGIVVGIEKNIPIRSGLGDKSSIIAGFLVGLNEIYHTNLSNHELIFLTSLVNFEAPYFIKGGYAKVFNVGNKITPLENNPYNNYLVIIPNIEVCTKDMFHILDKLGDKKLREGIFQNDFTNIMPEELKRIRNFLREYPDIFHSLSGIGPAYFIASEKYIDPKIKKVLKEEFPNCMIYTNVKNSLQRKIVRNY